MAEKSGEKQEERWSAWMAAAQRGEGEAYEQLLSELLPVIRTFVRIRLRNEDLVEEVTQTVLISIHRSRHTYRPERSILPWIRSIVRNAVIDAARSRKRIQDREVSWEPEELEETAAGEEIPEEELSPEIQCALEALPASQREAVEMLQLEELSVAEAASRLGISSSALKVRAHRGYQSLRALLGGVKDD